MLQPVPQAEIDAIRKELAKDLPAECPDSVPGIYVIAMEFASVPRYRFCGAYPPHQ